MPEMSAPGITDALVDDLDARRHDVVICNFANADMVGHTGSLDATIAAVETLDVCLGRIMTALRAAGGTAIVTADHGNAEQMWDDELNAPHTAHTSNPVPVILCDERVRRERRLRDGTLATSRRRCCSCWGSQRSAEMTGRSLLEVTTPTAELPTRQLEVLGIGSWKLEVVFIRLLFPAFRRRRCAATGGSACRWR